MNIQVQKAQGFPFVGVLAQGVDTQRVWADIEGIDLSRVSAKLKHDKGWSDEETELAVQSYRIFLYLTYKMRQEGKSVVPFKMVDEVWHAHILQSVSRYMSEIEEVLGFSLDHITSLHGEPVGGGSVLMGDALKMGYLPMMAHDSDHAECDGHASCEADFVRS